MLTNHLRILLNLFLNISKRIHRVPEHKIRNLLPTFFIVQVQVRVRDEFWQRQVQQLVVDVVDEGD